MSYSAKTATTETSGNAITECIVAIVGFSGYYMWDLSGVFSSVSPFAATLTLEEMAFLRTFLIFGIIAGLLVARTWGAAIYRHRLKVLGGGILLALIPLAIQTVNYLTHINLPFMWQVIGWAMLGVSNSALLLYWAIYFSSIPTRYTAIVIASSSCIGTLFFVGTSNMRPELLGLLAVGLGTFGSFAIVLYLINGIPQQRRKNAEDFASLPAFTLKSALSVGAHGIAFGFSTTTLLSLGTVATFVGCASGIIGSLLCLAWYSLGGNRINVDTSFLQRLTLPPVVIGLLLMPFGGPLWQLICCCVINIALSHFVVMGCISTAIANSEFALEPIRSSAIGRLPGWIGFFLGTLIASIIHFAYTISDRELMLIMVLIVSVIVFAAALYGMDDSKIEKKLLDLVTQREEDEIWTHEEDRYSRQFDTELDDLFKKYELSPREIDVFRLLAKGRNADYIGKKLVISNSTTKSHIYRIYRKMNINSQQTLIDLAEEQAKKHALSRSGGSAPSSTEQAGAILDTQKKTPSIGR